MKVVSRFFLIGALAAGSLAFTGTAQAGTDLSWSLTLGTPGVAVGVLPPAPVYYGAPVYVEPYPVYRAPRRHYHPRRYNHGYAPPRIRGHRAAPPYRGHRASSRRHR